MNFFDWFDLPVRFRLDENVLRRAFFSKSRRLHPDFHTDAPEAAQAEILEQATFNNEAYKTLADPYLRLPYILQLHGLLGDENKTALPQSFLMDMMDINEALMELEFDYDAEIFSKIKTSLDTLMQNLYIAVNELFDCDTVSGFTDENWQAIKIFYLKQRYLLRIREKLLTFAPQ